MTYVLDSSVVMKWFVEENDSAVARGFRDRMISGEDELAAPDLLLYEIANVLVRKKKVEVVEVQEVIRSVFQSGMTISAPEMEQFLHAVEIADETGASIYDSVFVAFAADLGWPLVTADERLAGLCGSAADIRLLNRF